jgi:four helix bundle protein
MSKDRRGISERGKRKEAREKSEVGYPKPGEHLFLPTGEDDELLKVAEDIRSGRVNSFEDLVVWQKSRRLTREIYSITKRSNSNVDRSLADQMRRSAVSIMSNISEGHERTGVNLFLQALSHSKGSCGELRSQLHVALDASLIKREDFDELYPQALEISRMITGLAKALQRSKGGK